GSCRSGPVGRLLDIGQARSSVWVMRAGLGTYPGASRRDLTQQTGYRDASAPGRVAKPVQLNACRALRHLGGREGVEWNVAAMRHREGGDGTPAPLTGSLHRGGGRWPRARPVSRGP